MELEAGSNHPCGSTFSGSCNRLFPKNILNAYRKVRRTNSRITGAFNEGIMGAKTTKTLVRGRGELK